MKLLNRIGPLLAQVMGVTVRERVAMQGNAGSSKEAQAIPARLEAPHADCADDVRALAAAVLELALGRPATVEEVDHARSQLRNGNAKEYLDALFANHQSVQNLLRATSGQTIFAPPGHYYSPIVDTTALRLEAEHTLPGMPFDLAQQLDNLRSLARHFDQPLFPEQQSESLRYYYDNQFFGSGDAVVLSAIIRDLRPNRIVEVGSGFSSAVILDTLDSAALQTVCTFIEPYPDRLKQLLRASDYDRIRIIESIIQSVDVGVFDELEANDILFFDTTHVCKTGSDVNHEVFKLLPRLRKGVFVHFHDIFDRFEYPESWIVTDNRSWNEMYLLRAFLMYNQEFEIYLMTDAILRAHSDEMARLNPAFSRNAGGALWLRRL